MATRQKPVDDTRDVELLDQLARARSALIEQIGKRIIGQHKICNDVQTICSLLGNTSDS